MIRCDRNNKIAQETEYSARNLVSQLIEQDVCSIIRSIFAGDLVPMIIQP